MESFPGSFPGVHGQVGSGSRFQSLNSNSPVRSALSPESMSIQKSLKTRRRALKKDLMLRLQVLWLMVSIICYLYDCSLLLLLMRFLSELSMSIYPEALPKKSVNQTVVVFSIVSQLFFALAIHLGRELPTPSEGGFVYGHHVVQIIGQKQLSSKYWLVLFDVAVFYIQMVTYSATFVTRKDSKTLEASAVDQEYDGIQGRTICVRMDFLNSMIPKWMSIGELHVIEEEQRRQTSNQHGSALARLLGGSFGEDYGTIEQPAVVQ